MNRGSRAGFTTPGASHSAIRIPMMGARHRGPLRPGRSDAGARRRDGGGGVDDSGGRSGTRRCGRRRCATSACPRTSTSRTAPRHGSDAYPRPARDARPAAPVRRSPTDAARQGTPPTAARPARSSTAGTPLQVARPAPEAAAARGSRRDGPGPAVRRRRRPRLPRRAASPRSHDQGLIDAEGHWSAGTARLWFLGDFTDRGPDGIGVIDLVMRLSAEAAAAGGYCKALMGNHELLLHRRQAVRRHPRQLRRGHRHLPGRLAAQRRPEAPTWSASRTTTSSGCPGSTPMVEEDGHLLVHSDTTAYLDYGDSIEAVNDTVHEILTRNDADECWDLFRKFTKRFAFRDEGGAAGRPRTARHLRRHAASSTATAPFRICSARSARRTARTATRPGRSTVRTCTRTGSPSPWTAA